MRLMMDTQFVRSKDPMSVSARQVIEMATINGAWDLGLADRTGSLTPGKRADLILVDLDDISLIPSADPIATVVLRVHAANVSSVFVDGQAKKRDGKLVGVDLANVRRLVDSSNGYLLGLAREAGIDIRRG
jgi:cytosine/adenosine deaminase-related metal-dependent hydrolase